MKRTTHLYGSVSLTPDLKEAVSRIALKEKRPFAAQASILLELGLAEYERMMSGSQRVPAEVSLKS